MTGHLIPIPNETQTISSRSHDYHNHINGIHYVQINSMSYYWAGEGRNQTPYDESLLKKYRYLSSMLRYKDPIWAMVTIHADGSAEIEGRQSGFMDVTPS